MAFSVAEDGFAKNNVVVIFDCFWSKKLFVF
jgi:hypothetical protein